MKRLLVALIALFTILPAASAVHADPPEPVDDCGKWFDWETGPGGDEFGNGYVTCWNGGARNIMWRVRINLTNRSTGDQVFKYDDWKSCNGVASHEWFNHTLFQLNNYAVAVDTDTVSDGC